MSFWTYPGLILALTGAATLALLCFGFAIYWPKYRAILAVVGIMLGYFVIHQKPWEWWS